MLTFKETMLKSIAAGIMIGFGGAVFLVQKNPLVGALFFTVGLFTIVEFGFFLFTGKACYLLQSDKAALRRLPVIWLGNLLGTGAVSLLLRTTRLAGAVTERASTMVAAKLGDSLASLFVLGCLCNLLIYVAVEGYNKSRYDLDRYLALFFGVMVFILSGFEHSIADMFYFWTGNGWNAQGVVAILVITAGNVVGGAFLPTLRQWAEEKPKSATTQAKVEKTE